MIVERDRTQRLLHDYAKPPCLAHYIRPHGKHSTLCEPIAFVVDTGVPVTADHPARHLDYKQYRFIECNTVKASVTISICSNYNDRNSTSFTPNPAQDAHPYRPARSKAQRFYRQTTGTIPTNASQNTVFTFFTSF